MSLVKRVRDKLDTRCLVDGRLTKKGCKVSMTGVTEPRLVVDFDKPGSPRRPDRPLCDYLFIAEDENGLGLGRSTRTETGPLACGRSCQTTPRGRCCR